MKNYGLDWDRELAETSDEDYVYGAVKIRGVAAMPAVDRRACLPIGEVQKGREDFQDCATRSPINDTETQFTWLYRNGKLSKEQRTFLKDNGYVNGDRVEFSDRYIAIKSGTTQKGNSLKAPLHAMHKNGLIPKKMFPADKKMKFEQYHDASKITPQMDRLAAEFLEHFTINYERVEAQDFPQVIKENMIGVAGYAWPRPDEKGVYPRSTFAIGHAFLYFSEPAYQIFDNYIDSHDGDFIKILAPDYILRDYGYRVYITNGEVSRVAERAYLAEIIQWAVRVIKRLAELLAEKGEPVFIEPPPPPPAPELPVPEPIKVKTNREKLYDVTAASLGKRMIMDKSVPDRLGCASSLSNVLIKAGVKGLPKLGIGSTTILHRFLLNSPQFEVVKDPLPGDVISSPTGTPGARLTNGHMGVVVKYGVCSNNSDNGIWSQHWTLPKWLDYYTTKGRIPTTYFRFK